MRSRSRPIFFRVDIDRLGRDIVEHRRELAVEMGRDIGVADDVGGDDMVDDDAALADFQVPDGAAVDPDVESVVGEVRVAVRLFDGEQRRCGRPRSSLTMSKSDFMPVALTSQLLSGLRSCREVERGGELADRAVGQPAARAQS